METQELFDILPTGVFTNAEELQKFLDDGDVNQLYPLLDKEKFPRLCQDELNEKYTWTTCTVNAKAWLQNKF